MKDALLTFFLVFLVMGGIRFFKFEIFDNGWIEAVAIGFVIAGLSMVLKKLFKLPKMDGLKFKKNQQPK